MAAGNYYLIVVIDSLGSVTESNEGDNQASLSYTVIAPELVILSLSSNKPIYLPNEVGTVTLTIKNQGSASSGSVFATTIYDSASLDVACGTTGDTTLNLGPLAAELRRVRAEIPDERG